MSLSGPRRQQQQLRGDLVGDVVVDLRAEHDDPLRSSRSDTESDSVIDVGAPPRRMAASAIEAVRVLGRCPAAHFSPAFCWSARVSRAGIVVVCPTLRGAEARPAAYGPVFAEGVTRSGASAGAGRLRGRLVGLVAPSRPRPTVLVGAVLDGLALAGPLPRRSVVAEQLRQVDRLRRTASVTVAARTAAISALPRRTSAKIAPSWSASCTRWTYSSGRHPDRCALKIIRSVNSSSLTPTSSARPARPAPAGCAPTSRRPSRSLGVELLAGLALRRPGTRRSLASSWSKAWTASCSRDSTSAFDDALRQRHLGRLEQRLEHLVPGLGDLLHASSPGGSSRAGRRAARRRCRTRWPAGRTRRRPRAARAP